MWRGQIGRREELARHITAALVRLEPDQEREIGVGADVVLEERDFALNEEFAQHDVTHRHGKRRIRPGLRGQPFVGELGVVGVVRADGDNFGAPITHFGHPVGVGRAGHRHVRAPHHQIGRVPPVARFGHIGLVPEYLRARYREIGIPVIERGHDAADELDEPVSGGVRHH